MAAPKLRFKEFDKAFSRNTIKELAKIYVGRDLVEDAYSPIKTETHIYPIYSNSVDNEGLYGYYNFEEFNFDDDALTVVGRGAGLGKAFYRQGGFGTIGRLLSLTPKDKSFHPKYLSDYINDKLIIHNESGGIPQLPRSSLENYEVVLPSYEEQTKIASFLSNVDEKISQLTQKHALLSQYKQGMMQKLFSQQLRFKADDGSEFGEWEEVKFSGIFNFHQTNSYSRALLAEYGEIMNIHYGDIHTKFSMLFDVNKESVPFLNDEVDTSKIAKEQFLKVGDLVIADASEDYKDIGKSIEVISLNNQKVVAGLHTYIARPVKPFALGFCGYMMQTFPVREQIKKLATGISVLGISKTNLGKVELKVPSLEEQTKIANFLSAIDQKIEVVVQQIEQAKTWKKGLLQQMFV